MSPEEIIIDVVTKLQGCKATELVARPEVATLDNVLELLPKLVKEGKLVEVEYDLPTISYRIKSLYFPAGTEIRQV